MLTDIRRTADAFLYYKLTKGSDELIKNDEVLGLKKQKKISELICFPSAAYIYNLINLDEMKLKFPPRQQCVVTECLVFHNICH